MKTFHGSINIESNMIETTEIDLENYTHFAPEIEENNSENGLEIERHEGVRLKPYECDFCEKSYMQSNQLIAHIKKIHISQPKLQNASLLEENYPETEDEENSAEDFHDSSINTYHSGLKSKKGAIFFYKKKY